jgi:hypothetical protein
LYGQENSVIVPPEALFYLTLNARLAPPTLSLTTLHVIVKLALLSTQSGTI